MKFILGKKIEMSQIFGQDGAAIPVTLVEAGPCVLTQIKNQEKDGYVAVQVGFGEKKKLSKALKGHFKDLGNFRYAREFRDRDEKLEIKKLEIKEDKKPGGIDGELKRGDIITVETFSVGDKVKVTGISKGKGFQGVVKRHGFHGHPSTHGHKDQERMPGSIGAGGVQHVIKGMRMGGHMGSKQVSVKNLEVVKIDAEKNILYLKGAVPGTRGSLVEIVGEGELKISKKQEKQEKGENEIEAGNQISDTSNQEEEKKLEIGNQGSEITPAPVVEEKTETMVVEEKVEAPAESNE